MANFWLVINGGTIEEFSSITAAQTAAKGYLADGGTAELHVNTVMSTEMASGSATSNFGDIPIFFEPGSGSTTRFDAFRIPTGVNPAGAISLTINGGTFTGSGSGGRVQGATGYADQNTSTTSRVSDVTLTITDSVLGGWVVNNAEAFMTGDANTTLTNCTMKGDVYGCHYGSRILGGVSLTIDGGTFTNNSQIRGNSQSKIDGEVAINVINVTGGSIFGTTSAGGTSSYTKSGKVTVNVTGSTMRWISGSYSKLTVNGAIEVNVTGSTISGGPFSTYNAAIEGNRYAVTCSGVSVSVTDSLVKNTVYGSNDADASDYAKVGDVSVSFTGGTGTNVYGTNQTVIAGTVAVSIQDAQLSGNVVVMDGGTATGTELLIGASTSTDTWIKKDLAGGGYRGIVTGTASVELDGGTVGVSGSTITKRNVYGGGYFASCTVKATDVEIKGATYVTGSVFGGGRGGSVETDTQITLSSGTVAGTIYGGGTKYDSGSGTDNGICNVGGNTNVTIAGGTLKGTLYGGGTQTSTVSGNTNISIASGRVSGSVYGGGVSGSDVAGTATISITGGVFGNSSNVFGGGKLSVAGDNAGAYHQASDVTMNAASSKVQRLAGGAQITAALEGGYTLSGDTSVTLAGGTVTQAVIGRANTAIGTAVADGDGSTLSTVNISGGWANIVAGAGLVTKENASYNYNGDTEINVSGGTIDYLFGGNVGSKKEFCIGTEMTGDVAITVDTSVNTVTLKYLYAGSNSSTGYEAAQEGNTLVTFTGLGSNLIWTEGGLSGDGSGKLGDIDKTQYSRTLLFDDFSGVFSAPVISRFDVIDFVDSDVIFGADSLYLSGVETWNFSLGSSLVWNNARNSFAGDDLFFGTTGDTVSTDWEVVTSNNNKAFGGWSQANITLFGTALDTFDDDTLTWSAAGFGYVAKWDDEDHKIIIAQA